MASGSSDRRDPVPGVVGTVVIHLLALFLFLNGKSPPPPEIEDRNMLAVFDVIQPPPPPPLPPPPPEPVIKPAERHPLAGGAPRTRAPVKPQIEIAAPARPTATLLLNAPAMPPVPPTPDIGSADTAASGAGGRGKGSGKGNGDGPGDGGPVRYRRAEWIRTPSDKQFAYYFPRSASKSGVSGKAVLACELKHAGRPRHCWTLSESPAGYGFGDAAISLAHVSLIRPVTRNEANVDMPVIVSIAFDVINAAKP